MWYLSQHQRKGGHALFSDDEAIVFWKGKEDTRLASAEEENQLAGDTDEGNGERGTRFVVGEWKWEVKGMYFDTRKTGWTGEGKVLGEREIEEKVGEWIRGRAWGRGGRLPDKGWARLRR
jgi:hypothetical protein